MTEPTFRQRVSEDRLPLRPGVFKALALVLGFILTFFLAYFVRDWEVAMIRADFEFLAGTHAANISKELERHVDLITSISGLYGASQEVERGEFRRFIRDNLRLHNDVQAVAWAPRVVRAARAGFERTAHATGYAGFRFTELDPGGAFVEAGTRDEYFPIYFIEPEADNSHLLGYDLLSNPVIQDELARARDTAQAVTVGRIPFDHLDTEQYGALQILPVYRNDLPHATPEQRRRNLAGYLLQVFRIGDMVVEALKRSTVRGIDVWVFDEAAPGDQRFLHHHHGDGSAAEALQDHAPAPPASLMSWWTRVDLPGLRWSLLFTPTPAYLAANPMWRWWAVLIAGSALSLLLFFYLQAMAARTARIEELAVGLAGTNEELEKAMIQMRKLSRALEQSADSVMITDADGTIEYVNPAFTTMTGYRGEEVFGKRPDVLKSDRHDAAFFARLWSVIKQGRVFQDIFVNRKKDGSLYYEEKTITPLKDERGRITHFISNGKDITERMQAEERLHQLAYHDILTELPNRALFMERLDHALRRRGDTGKRIAVLFLDLDRFKNVNDTLGHDLGDRLLQALPERLTGCVRRGDTVARFGGDEFAVLLEDIASDEAAAQVANKIIDAMARPFLVGGNELFLTTSIGISLYPDDSRDAHTLLKHADAAMYRAKDLGRNNYQFYSNDMSVKAFERLSLETSLRHALDREEFELRFQPQVELEGGSVIGAEALLRWRHPDLGMINPARFVPLLEETGLIIPVGEWVLHQACRQAGVWRRQVDGRGLRVAVNLSGRQFHDPRLKDRVAAALGDSGLDPALLELEITESVLMQNDRVSMDNIDALKALGVHLSIDDFGTGYSSLSYLKRFPVDAIKIDRSFIHDLCSDPEDATLVTTIIVMAHSLRLNVVAEGVETEEQLAFLRRCGCDAMQGFLFSQPLGPVEMTEFLKGGRSLRAVSGE